MLYSEIWYYSSIWDYRIWVGMWESLCCVSRAQNQQCGFSHTHAYCSTFNWLWSTFGEVWLPVCLNVEIWMRISKSLCTECLASAQQTDCSWFSVLICSTMYHTVQQVWSTSIFLNVTVGLYTMSPEKDWEQWVCFCLRMSARNCHGCGCTLALRREQFVLRGRRNLLY